MGEVTLVHGDLAALEVDAQVNAWNRNVLPWFLLVPQGVSRAIRKRAGWRPFWTLWWKGPIPLGQARVTDGGKGPAGYLIHAAGIGLAWRVSERSVTHATDSAIKLAFALGCRSLAFPLIGAGTGGLGPERVLALMWPYLTAASPGFERVLVAVPDEALFHRLRGQLAELPTEPAEPI